MNLIGKKDQQMDVFERKDVEELIRELDWCDRERKRISPTGEQEPFMPVFVMDPLRLADALRRLLSEREEPEKNPNQ